MVRMAGPATDLGRKADPALGATRRGGELAFLAPLTAHAASAPAEWAVLRQHRQHCLQNPGRGWFRAAPFPFVADAADGAGGAGESVLASAGSYLVGAAPTAESTDGGFGG